MQSDAAPTCHQANKAGRKLSKYQITSKLAAKLNTTVF